MTVNELLRLIPGKLFEDLAVETTVDHQVKKLTGETMFKLILFSMLNTEKLSLRVMESFLSSSKFRHFAHTDHLESRYNSIRDRICTINAEYFEKLFTTIFSIYNKELKEEKALTKTDSTYVSLAAALFNTGMSNGRDVGRRFIKYSISIKGGIPSAVKPFTEQSYVNEDLALAAVINGSDDLCGETVVFDRGLQSRQSFDKFTGSNKFFITRTKANTFCKVTEIQQPVAKPPNSTISITDDIRGKLVGKKGKRTSFDYRIIKGVIDNSGEPIGFLTNLMDEDAYLVAQWYKERWEIELFFKFLKQHLNLNHLVSRSENGIKVMLYMTMIVATLIIVYKKSNNIKGYKLAKLKFEIELDNELIKEIVILCGGDPAKAANLWKSP